MRARREERYVSCSTRLATTCSLSRRNKQARFFTLLLPLVFLVILVGMFGNHTVGPAHIKESTYFVPGLAALAVISSSFVNLVMSITAQRESGVLKRRRVTPVPASVLIAGRALSTMTVSLGVLAAVLVVGRFAYDVRLPVGAIPAVALIAIVGSITFCVLGYALSSLIGSADAAQPIVQAIVLPLYFISGVFVPAVELPAWLRRVAEVFPVERLADSLHQAFDVARARHRSPGATSVSSPSGSVQVSRSRSGVSSGLLPAVRHDCAGSG